MLGRSYYLEGKVAEGRKIGRTIGFPTANLEYNEKSLLPKEGVYYTPSFSQPYLFLVAVLSLGLNAILLLPATFITLLFISASS